MTRKEIRFPTDKAAPDSSQLQSINAPAPKRAYRCPELISYGLVKELTRSDSGTVGDGQGMNMMASDPSFKEQITRIGEHPWGFGLYLYDYKPEFRDAFGHGRQFGVMADEMERVCPEAVRRNSDGRLMIDYSRVGVVNARKDRPPP